jgi:hypothetical protein
VYVQLSVVRQVVVDDEGHLRDIQPPGPDICGNEHSAAERRGVKVRLELPPLLMWARLAPSPKHHITVVPLPLQCQECHLEALADGHLV